MSNLIVRSISFDSILPAGNSTFSLFKTFSTNLAPINPVKLGRGMKERIAARRAARRAAEEEAESRVFGPR